MDLSSVSLSSAYHLESLWQLRRQSTWWYWLLLIVVSQSIPSSMHLSRSITVSPPMSKMFAKLSTSPPTGSSQQILYEIIVLTLIIQDTFLSVSTLPLFPMYFSKMQIDNVMRNGMGTSYILSTILRLKTQGGSSRVPKVWMVSAENRSVDEYVDDYVTASTLHAIETRGCSFLGSYLFSFSSPDCFLGRNCSCERTLTISMGSVMSLTARLQTFLKMCSLGISSSEASAAE